MEHSNAAGDRGVEGAGFQEVAAAHDGELAWELLAQRSHLAGLRFGAHRRHDRVAFLEEL
eukprot:COSAG03_NODE_134_length_11903_cov_30.799729_3_plen_60_part_00